ncbi:MAG: hypothetical protein Rubg2KO_11420 [Rubricoccaceae bacterium]
MRISLLVLVALIALPAQAQTHDLVASPVEAGAIRLDGVLDEPAWASAELATDFVQFRPESGAPATETTVGRVLIGPSALYIGMRMEDRQPEAIDTRLARRDEGVSSDQAAIVIDSYGDRRTGFFFRVSPGGVKMDILFYDDNEADRSWDAVWDVETTQDESGWTAEFRIPLSQLRYAGGTGPHAWGFQLARIHFRTNELSYWTPRRPEDTGYVSQFGTLKIPGALPAPRRVEVLPYVASTVTRAPGDAANPFYDATAFSPRVGLDAKLGLTSGLTLAATLNPDFGQVEADPAQVNLGGFELFFQERRPFFVEGTDVFSMAPRRAGNRRPNLLYTRRIGRSPQRSSFVSSETEEAAGDNGAIYTDAPQQSTILGAAKLSGQVGRFSVGLLNATTRAEVGRVQAFDADRQLVAEDRAIVEPQSNYLVGRARGTFGQTIVGGLATSVLRDTGDPAIADQLPTSATVVGVDVEHIFSQQWRMTAQAVGSTVTGSELAISGLQTAFPRSFQRPDADHLTLDSTRTSLAGWSAEANLLKTDGDHWTGGIHAAATSPGFDANELGFQARADIARLEAALQYSQNDPQGALNSWQAELATRLSWNFDGDPVRTVLAGEVGGQFSNFWSVQLSADATPRNLDDRLTRGGPVALRDAGGFFGVSVNSDSRQPVTGSLNARVVGNELGRVGTGGSLEIEGRLLPQLSLSIEPDVTVTREPRQYVTAFDEPAATATFGRRYVFGQLDATTVALAARVDWTFTPELTLQLYARPFATRGLYSAFKDFDRPRAFELPVFGEDLGTATENTDGSTTIDPGDGGASFTLDRDFTVRSLQGNAVLRWEYMPGSTLFLVWQQQREGFESDGALRFGRDVRGLFTDAPTNVFLVKLSYWLG